MDIDDFDEIFLLDAYKSGQEHQDRQRMHTGQSGQDYIQELLDIAHPERILHVLRMQLDTFYALRDWLVENTDLKGVNITYNQRIRGQGKQVSIEEKLVIFIFIISKGASNRDTGERFSRSNNTISL
jgi:hypothetical protein